MVLMVFVLAAVGTSATAQNAETAALPAELEAQMSELEQVTENLRGLKARTPVTRAFPTRDEVRAYIAEVYERELTPELAERSLALYVGLGLLEPGTDLRALFIDVMGSQVAGYYDSDTGLMNVIPVIGDDPGTRLSITEQIIYVHEYVHALQDQYFGLDDFMEAPELLDHPDLALARLSLVEGDASTVMNLYTQLVASSNPLAALSILAEGLQAGNLLPPGNVPPAIMRELMFPYETGALFVMRLYSEGGWEAVNAAFENPPTTSEQILHPEKYLSGEIGQVVELLPIGDVLDASWLLRWDTALGEFYLGEHLMTELPRRTALAAAAGWGGDRIQIYSNAAGEAAWVLRLTWDTPAEADEFAQAYADFNARRTADQGQIVISDGVTCASAAVVICYNDDASVVASAPDLDLARALIATQLGG